MKNIILFFLLFPLFIFSQNSKLTKIDIEKLDYFIVLADSLRVKSGVPGVGMSIVCNNEIIYKDGLGYSNLSTKTLATSHTLFSIGSNTKAFTGVLIAKLVAQKKMDWNTSLKTYIPELDLKEDYIENNATIKDALSHATGLGRYDTLWKYKNISRDEMLLSLKDLDFVDDFRASFVYNSLMFSVAGIAAERATGKSWESLVISEILNPLGMNSTYVTFNDFINHKNKSIGYKADGFTPEQEVNTTSVAPAGAISSNPEDMSKWVLMLTNNHNSFLTSDSYNYIMSPHSRLSIRNTDELWYYYAGLGGFSKNGNRNIGHSGSIDGQNSMVIIRPDDGFGIMIMTNKISSYKDLLVDYAQEWFIEGKITRQYDKEFSLEAVNHSYVIERLLNEGKKSKSIAYYNHLDKTKLGPYLEANMNTLGYIYINANDLEKAILILKLNAENNPNSYNAYDSLGEVLLKIGNKSEAIKAYKKSLEINPKNDNAINVLKSLK